MLRVVAGPSWPTRRVNSSLPDLTEHGARISRCRPHGPGAEGRKTHVERPLGTTDESATGSVSLFFRRSTPQA